MVGGRGQKQRQNAGCAAVCALGEVRLLNAVVSLRHVALTNAQHDVGGLAHAVIRKREPVYEVLGQCVGRDRGGRVPAHRVQFRRVVEQRDRQAEVGNQVLGRDRFGRAGLLLHVIPDGQPHRLLTPQDPAHAG